MSVSDGARKVLSIMAGVVLAIALVPQGTAQASPEGDLRKAKVKLAKLNKEVDKLVDRYNDRNEKAKKARAKLKSANDKLSDQQAKVDEMRVGIVSIANADYQGVAVFGAPGLLSVDRPDELLSRLAAAGYIVDSQAAVVKGYMDAAEELATRRDEAKSVADEATGAEKEAKAEKDKVEKKIKEQLKLIRRLGEKIEKANPGGKKYTGPASGNARAALEYAYAQIGKPYRYGGTGPDGFDCSGLVMMSWRKGGVSLPRTTNQQYSWGKSKGRTVAWSNLQAGDIVFADGLGHNGLYAGEGKIVHSPRTGKNVEEVSASGWRSRFYGAVRP